MKRKKQVAGVQTLSRRMLGEHPLLVVPVSLAMLTSLNEAIVLHQIHYWLELNEGKSSHLRKDRVWCRNTYQQWRDENFPFWSETTVKRTFEKLMERGLVIKGRFNRMGYDRTGWYTIDYDALDRFVEEKIQSGQIDPSVRSNWPDGMGQNDGTIPETTTETTTDNSDDVGAVVGDVQVELDVLTQLPDFANWDITEREKARFDCPICGTEASIGIQDMVTKCCQAKIIWNNTTGDYVASTAKAPTKISLGAKMSSIDSAAKYIESATGAGVTKKEVADIEKYVELHGLQAFVEIVDEYVQRGKEAGRYGRAVIRRIVNWLPFAGGPGRPEPDSIVAAPEPKMLEC